MKNERAYGAFCAFSVLIPVLEAAAGKNWLPSLILVLLCTLVRMAVDAIPTAQPDWLRTLQTVAITVLLSHFLQWMHIGWPGNGAKYVVPGVVLLLAAFGVSHGSAVGACAALRHGVCGVLLLLAVAGAGELPLHSLWPKAELPDGALAVALLLPLLSARKSGGDPLAASVLALVPCVMIAPNVGIYEWSRTLKLGGTFAGLESLAACALTVGWFSTACYLLEHVDGYAAHPRPVWTVALCAWGMHALDLHIPVQLLALAMVVLWGIFPALCAIKRKSEKVEKSP